MIQATGSWARQSGYPSLGTKGNPEIHSDQKLGAGNPKTAHLLVEGNLAILEISAVSTPNPWTPTTPPASARNGPLGPRTWWDLAGVA